MSKTYKKFNEFIKESDDKKSDSSLEPICERCELPITDCVCDEEDYFDATLKHYTPKGENKKGNYHG